MSRAALPTRGTVWKELEEELLALKSKDGPWRKGIFFFNWPNPGGHLQLGAKEAASLFFNQLVIGRKMQSSAQKLAKDLQDFTLSLFSAPEEAVCTLTSGGTESNFHAVKVMRDKALARRQVSEPELIVSDTAHPSLDKACAYMGVRTIRVPAAANFRADLAAMAKAISKRTIGLVGSAPSYPYGLCDDIESMAHLALEHDLHLHVDACIGGFLIPFFHRLGRKTPAFDFTIPGVSSISADLHKFGYAPTGISTFSLRSKADLEHQLFRGNLWASGEYVTQTIAGSYSAAPIAAAWAMMRQLGEEGYLRIARGILDTETKLRAGLTALDGFRLTVEPEAGILLYTADLDVPALSWLLTQRGYVSSLTRTPPSIHLLLDPMEDEGHISDYLAAVAAAAAEVRAGKATGPRADASYA